MDCLHLTRIRAYGYCGVLPEEQVLGQWFEVDLTLWLDLSRGGQSDRLTDTLDYRQVIGRVQHLIQTARVALIERLATLIATDVLQQPLVQQVQVKLTKVAVPIANFDGRVTVELTRSRTQEPSV